MLDTGEEVTDMTYGKVGRWEVEDGLATTSPSLRLPERYFSVIREDMKI